MRAAADPELRSEGLMEERVTKTRETRAAPVRHAAEPPRSRSIVGDVRYRRGILVLLLVLLSVELLWVAAIAYLIYHAV